MLLDLGAIERRAEVAQISDRGHENAAGRLGTADKDAEILIVEDVLFLDPAPAQARPQGGAQIEPLDQYGRARQG
jgi:hypothetical protein